MKNFRPYLLHILQEIDYIENALESMSFEKFVASEHLKRSIVRSLEIIGEAVKNLPRNLRAKYKNFEWRKIAEMRDRLIHKYFGLDYAIVWDVVQHYIPELKKIVMQILEEVNASSQR